MHGPGSITRGLHSIQRHARNSQVPDMSLIFLPLQEQDSFEPIGEIIASASIDNRGL